MPEHRQRQYTKVKNRTLDKTSGGLTSRNIGTRYVNGQKRYFSKKKSKLAKKNFGPWNKAVAKAKKNLGIKKHDMVLINVGKKGIALYEEAASIYYD